MNKINFFVKVSSKQNGYKSEVISYPPLYSEGSNLLDLADNTKDCIVQYISSLEIYDEMPEVTLTYI